MFIKFVLLVALFFSVSIFPALAHDSIYSLKKFVGDKVIVINYNVDHPHAGLLIQFNTRLYTLENGSPVEYEKLLLEFKRGKNLVYSQEFSPKNINEVDSTYTFLQPGDYEMEVKFKKDSTIIASAVFPVPVDKKINTSGINLWSAETGIGLVSGLILTFGCSVAFENSFKNLKEKFRKLPMKVGH